MHKYNTYVCYFNVDLSFESEVKLFRISGSLSFIALFTIVFFKTYEVYSIRYVLDY